MHQVLMYLLLLGVLDVQINGQWDLNYLEIELVIEKSYACQTFHFTLYGG